MLYLLVRNQTLRNSWWKEASVMKNDNTQLYIGLIAALIMVLFTRSFDNVLYAVICMLLNMIVEAFSNDSK